MVRLYVKLTVSSFHIAWSCVPSMTAVNMAKSRASAIRNSNKTTVAGGEYALQSLHSCRIHVTNWYTAKLTAWTDIAAI